MSNDVRFDKINLFHGLTAELPANLSNKVKSVVTVHDLIFLRYPEYYKPIDRWLYARKCRNACEQADLIIAISQQTKQDIVDFFGIDEQKIRLVYQGCDPQFYAEVLPHRLQMVKRLYRLPDRYILYVGTIEARKNLKALVKALAQLPDDVHLVCVGRETEYALAVRETADELNVLSRVQFLPQVAFKHLPAIYRQAQTFCLPSLFEGFGIPVLEALNAQVPVVTSNSSSLPEAAGNGALLVNPSDDAEIAHALRQTLDDPELRLRMISAGTLHARQFREDAIAHNLWRVYKELVP